MGDHGEGSDEAFSAGRGCRAWQVAVKWPLTPTRRRVVRGSGLYFELRYWILAAGVMGCLLLCGGDEIDSDTEIVPRHPRIQSYVNDSQCPGNVTVNGTQRTWGNTEFEVMVAVFLEPLLINGTRLLLPKIPPDVDNITNITSYKYSIINATCNCSNGTLNVLVSNTTDEMSQAISKGKSSNYSIDAVPKGTIIPDFSKNATRIPLLWDVKCITTQDFRKWCSWGLVEDSLCQFRSFKTITTVVYVENVVTITYNVTKTVNQSTSTGDVLQREIDAFLASFQNPTTYFYQSNLGVGEFANVMLWAGFLFFCLISITLQWMSSRMKRKESLPMMLHTLSSTFTMLGYLVMAFGHGRSYDSQVIFGSERNSTSGSLFYSGNVLYIPHVPPFFYSRYIMWMASTTPNLFLLCLHVGANAMTIFRVLALNLGALFGGLIASAASTSPGVVSKWVFYTFACLLFTMLVIQLTFPMRKAAKQAGTLAHYNKLLAFVLFFWPLYPILWLIGPKGLQAFGTDVEVVLYVFLDILSKLGFIVLYNYLLSVAKRMGVKKPKQAWQVNNGLEGELPQKGFLASRLSRLRGVKDGAIKALERTAPGTAPRSGPRPGSMVVEGQEDRGLDGVPPTLWTRTARMARTASMRLGSVLSVISTTGEAGPAAGDATDASQSYGRHRTWEDPRNGFSADGQKGTSVNV